MKLSARNQLKGKIVAIKHGPVSAEVVIELPGGAQITSVVTDGSVAALGLAVGGEAYAIVKASNVILAVD